MGASIHSDRFLLIDPQGTLFPDKTGPIDPAVPDVVYPICTPVRVQSTVFEGIFAKKVAKPCVGLDIEIRGKCKVNDGPGWLPFKLCIFVPQTTSGTRTGTPVVKCSAEVCLTVWDPRVGYAVYYRVCDRIPACQVVFAD